MLQIIRHSSLSTQFVVVVFNYQHREVLVNPSECINNPFYADYLQTSKNSCFAFCLILMIRWICPGNLSRCSHACLYIFRLPRYPNQKRVGLIDSQWFEHTLALILALCKSDAGTFNLLTGRCPNDLWTSGASDVVPLSAVTITSGPKLPNTHTQEGIAVCMCIWREKYTVLVLLFKIYTRNILNKK